MKIPIEDRHIFRMTDDTGMLQHAVCGVPDPSEGYTVDDNARALIMAILLYQKTQEKKYEDLLFRYSGFLIYAQKNRWFRNFMGYNRNFLEKRGSEDSFGRCICALGYTVAQSGLPSPITETAQRLLRRTCPSCSSLSYLKGKAYALIGLILWNDNSVEPGIRMLSDSIVDTYVQCRREDWRWFENIMTYCSAILPLSLFYSYEKLKQNQALSIGLESLDFLLDSTMTADYFKPVGCKGWYEKGKAPAEFDEQPVEACGMMLSCLKAFQLTGDEKYRKKAEACVQWYLGKNSKHLSLIDGQTGGCRDGLTPEGVNRNEGAESIVCCSIALLTAENEKLSLEF